jgi:hypothetical protein
MWKEAAVAYFKVLSQYLPGGMRHTMKKCNQDSLSPGRDVNQRPPEYESYPLAPTFGHLTMVRTISM